MITTCYFCTQQIQAGDVVNEHHVTYRSQGGTHTEPTHQECHRAYHSERGDFRAWGQQGGKLSALTRRWSINLKNVRSDPAYEMDRAYYRALYAH